MRQRVASCSGVRRRPSRRQPIDVLGHLLPAPGDTQVCCNAASAVQHVAGASMHSGDGLVGSSQVNTPANSARAAYVHRQPGQSSSLPGFSGGSVGCAAVIRCFRSSSASVKPLQAQVGAMTGQRPRSEAQQRAFCFREHMQGAATTAQQGGAWTAADAVALPHTYMPASARPACWLEGKAGCCIREMQPPARRAWRGQQLGAVTSTKMPAPAPTCHDTKKACGCSKEVRLAASCASRGGTRPALVVAVAPPPPGAAAAACSATPGGAARHCCLVSTAAVVMCGVLPGVPHEAGRRAGPQGERLRQVQPSAMCADIACNDGIAASR